MVWLTTSVVVCELVQWDSQYQPVGADTRQNSLIEEGKVPKAKVNGITIGYKVDGQGEPLVMIMGFSLSRRYWAPQTPTFKKHYQVITFDNRGVGKTDKPTEPYTVKTMADDTIGLMDRVGIDRAHILGISMGGMVAQEIAINYPERVGKLLLASTYAGGHEMEVTSPEMVKAVGFEGGYSEDDMSRLAAGKLTGSAVSLSFNSRLYRLIFALLAKICASINIVGLTGQLEAVLSHNTLSRLHMIKAPTLVIAGTEDRVVAPGCSDKLASMIPNARLVKVEGGSHALFMEMRGRFNREVLDFLRRG